MGVLGLPHSVDGGGGRMGAGGGEGVATTPLQADARWNLSSDGSELTCHIISQRKRTTGLIRPAYQGLHCKHGMLVRLPRPFSAQHT